MSARHFVRAVSFSFRRGFVSSLGLTGSAQSRRFAVVLLPPPPKMDSEKMNGMQDPRGARPEARATATIFPGASAVLGALGNTDTDEPASSAAQEAVRSGCDFSPGVGAVAHDDGLAPRAPPGRKVLQAGALDGEERRARRVKRLRVEAPRSPVAAEVWAGKRGISMNATL